MTHLLCHELFHDRQIKWVGLAGTVQAHRNPSVHKSYKVALPGGIPQGLYLGPLLFNLYMLLLGDKKILIYIKIN